MKDDKLVKSLQMCANCTDSCEGCVLEQEAAPSCHHKLMKQAADAIEELSRENESLAKSVNEASDILRRRWIPVTERLPKPNVDVLVWSKKNDALVDFLDERKHFAVGDITHWMPLPEPPEEG